jgi:hypothetical protein
LDDGDGQEAEPHARAIRQGADLLAKAAVGIAAIAQETGRSSFRVAVRGILALVVTTQLTPHKHYTDLFTSN